MGSRDHRIFHDHFNLATVNDNVLMVFRKNGHQEQEALYRMGQGTTCLELVQVMRHVVGEFFVHLLSNSLREFFREPLGAVILGTDATKAHGGRL